MVLPLLSAFAFGCSIAATPADVTPAAPRIADARYFTRPISRLAFINVRLDHEMDVDDEVHWRIGRIIEEQLRAKGFDVVPYDESVHLFFDKGLEQGGFFDAETGQFYLERWKTALDFLVQHYATDEPIDAVVMASVDLAAATYSDKGGVAYFCNTAQPMRSYDINFMELLLMSTSTQYVDATCLTLRISDPDENNFYAARGGIEPQGMLTPSGLQAVPREQLLGDQRIRDAVDLAARGLEAPFVHPSAAPADVVHDAREAWRARHDSNM